MFPTVAPIFMNTKCSTDCINGIEPLLKLLFLNLLFTIGLMTFLLVVFPLLELFCSWFFGFFFQCGFFPGSICMLLLVLFIFEFVMRVFEIECIYKENKLIGIVLYSCRLMWSEKGVNLEPLFKFIMVFSSCGYLKLKIVTQIEVNFQCVL